MSDSVEYGRVISQTPDAERTVKVGTTILLTFSGRARAATPFVNQTVQAAQTALNALSVQVTVNIEMRPACVHRWLRHGDLIPPRARRSTPPGRP